MECGHTQLAASYARTRRLGGELTKEESHCNTTGKVVNCCRGGRYAGPNTNPEGKAERRSHTSQYHVARELHEHVPRLLTESVKKMITTTSTYPTLRIETAVLNCWPTRPRSSSKSFSFACLTKYLARPNLC